MWVYWQTLEIRVTSPSSTDNWEDGNTYTITWTSTGPIDRVTIELYKASILIKEITVSYTDNDGSYDFYCRSSYDFDEGTNYRIKLTDYDDSGLYDYSSNFAINYQEPLNNRQILVGLIVIAVVGVIVLIIFIARHQSHKRRTLQPPPQYIQQQVPRPAVQQVPQNINENFKFCENCGQRNKKHFKFCKACGREMVD